MFWGVDYPKKRRMPLIAEKNMLRASRGFGSILLLGILFFFCGDVPAQEMFSRSLEGLGFPQESRVEGAEGAFSAFFSLPRMEALSGEMLWHITPSEVLRNESLFTFYINERPVARRTAGELRQNPRVRIPLPRDLPQASFLHARVESRISITNDLCEDRFTGQLFFRVHGDSLLTFKDLRIPHRTVSDFFETLFDSLRIVLPREPSLAESQAAIWLGAFLRKASPGMRISFVSELREEDPSPFILLAESSGSLPEDFEVPKGISLMEKRGLVLFAQGEAGVLGDMVQSLVCGPAFGAIPSSSILPERLDASERIPQTNILPPTQGRGHHEVLLEVPVFPGLLPSVPETLSFELEGAFTIPPGGERPPRMDVYWNNVFIQSEQLFAEGNFRKKILLPSGIALATENRLRLMISYQMDEGMCRYQAGENRASLLPSSTYRGHGSYPLQALSWNAFGLFAPQKGVFLLDPSLSVPLVQSAADMLFWLSGSYPEGVFLFPEVHTTLEEPSYIKDASWVVAVISPQNIPEFLTNMLPLDLRRGLLLRKQQRGTFLYLYEEEEDLALFLLGNTSKPVILLSSPNPRMMEEAAAFFTASESAGFIRGNLMAFRSSRDVRTFDTRSRFVTVERGLIRPLLERLWFQYREVFLLGLWVLMTLFFGSLFLKRRQKK